MQLSVFPPVGEHHKCLCSCLAIFSAVACICFYSKYSFGSCSRRVGFGDVGGSRSRRGQEEHKYQACLSRCQVLLPMCHLVYKNPTEIKLPLQGYCPGCVALSLGSLFLSAIWSTWVSTWICFCLVVGCYIRANSWNMHFYSFIAKVDSSQYFFSLLLLQFSIIFCFGTGLI